MNGYYGHFYLNQEKSYFINRSLENERQRFTLNVKTALSLVSKQIDDYEYRNYLDKLQPYLINTNDPDSTAVQRLFVAFDDNENDRTIVHQNIVLEERFRIPSLFFEIDADSMSVSKLTSERVTEVYSNSALDRGSTTPLKQYRQVNSMPTDAQKFLQKENL